jgi:hypothetical protein
LIRKQNENKNRNFRLQAFANGNGWSLEQVSMLVKNHLSITHCLTCGMYLMPGLLWT